MADSEHRHHHHHHHSNWEMLIRYRLHVFFKYLSFFPLVTALFLLGVFPIFYFGGRLWWQWLVLLILISAYGFWAIANWWCGGKALNVRPLAAFFALPLAYGLFQLLPCSALVKFLSPKSASFFSSFDIFLTFCISFSDMDDGSWTIKFHNFSLDINQVIVLFTLFLAEILAWVEYIPYLCSVFFIVLDLRLTKVGVQRYSFFCAYRLWHL